MKKKNLEFGKYLDISTAHISPKDCSLLAEKSCSVIHYSYVEGYFVHVPPDDYFLETLRVIKDEGFSKQFTTLLCLAQDNGCNFIRLDRDGAEISGLKKFKW